MKKWAVLLLMLVATVSSARTRDWKIATVIGIDEKNVSGPLVRETHTMHYTVETEDMVFLLNYSFHPSGNNSAPLLAVNAITKIAVAGRHAYILDNAGAEVKMHIVRKSRK